MTSRRAHGFTLIELLVAMAVVAVIGVMAMTGLSEVIHQQTLARERAARPFAFPVSKLETESVQA
jgi:prepilin-type N-terminal cleavage/methylation domain-containing protein